MSIDAVLSGAATHHVACERAESFIDRLPDGCVSLMTLDSSVGQRVSHTVVMVRVTPKTQRHKIAQLVVLGPLVLLLVMALNHVARRRWGRGRFADALHAADLAAIPITGIDLSSDLAPVRSSERDVLHAGPVHVGRVSAACHAFRVGEVETPAGAVLVLFARGTLESTATARTRSLVLRLPIVMRSARALRCPSALWRAVALRSRVGHARRPAVRTHDLVLGPRADCHGQAALVASRYGYAAFGEPSRDVMVVPADIRPHFTQRHLALDVQFYDPGGLDCVSHTWGHRQSL